MFCDKSAVALLGCSSKFWEIAIEYLNKTRNYNVDWIQCHLSASTWCARGTYNVIWLENNVPFELFARLIIVTKTEEWRKKHWKILGRKH